MTGFLTPSLWQEYAARGDRIAVVVDGVDVTTRCAASDDRQGWAVVYRLDAAGRKYRNAGKVATDLLVGRVKHLALEAV